MQYLSHKKRAVVWDCSLLLKLRGEFEADVGEFLDCEGEGVGGICEEYIPAVLVDSHIRELAAFEVGELLGIVALDPASLMDGDGLPAALGAILVLQAVLDNLKLQSTHSADNLATIERRGEELCHTLIHQLVDTLGELFELLGVGILDVAEHLGCKRGDTREFEFFALGERVANLEVTRIVQTHDITRIGGVHHRFLLCEEDTGRGELHLLATANVKVVLATLERTTTYLKERNMGYTVLDGYGSKDKMNMIFIVLARKEASKTLKDIRKICDNKVFVVASEVSKYAGGYGTMK